MSKLLHNDCNQCAFLSFTDQSRILCIFKETDFLTLLIPKSHLCKFKLTSTFFSCPSRIADTVSTCLITCDAFAVFFMTVTL